MMVLLTFLAVFYSLSIDRSIYRLYFDYKTEEDKKNYLGTITITMILNAFFVLVIVLMSEGLISKIYSTIPHNPYYLYIIATAFFSIFGIIPKIYFQVEQKPLKFILISLFEFAVTTGLIIYFIVDRQMGAQGMLLAGLISSVIFLPLFIFITLKVINFTFNYDIMKESLLFSLPLMPMILAAWILNLSDRIFIENFNGLKEVGIYSIAYKMAEILLVFTAAFSNAYDPIFFKIANQKNQIDAQNKLSLYNKAFIIILIICALGITLFTREFFLLLDKQYFSAIYLVPIIMIGVLFSNASSIFNLSIYQAKKTKLIMYLTFSSALLNIILNWLIVPTYGAQGAAFTTAISFIFFFALKYYYSKKTYFIIFAWKELGIYSAIAVVCVGFFNFFSYNFWPSIIIKSIVMLIFIGFIILINIKQINFSYPNNSFFKNKIFNSMKMNKKK
jgi:O-antigen/teichoic acid export membrane protein